MKHLEETLYAHLKDALPVREPMVKNSYRAKLEVSQSNESKHISDEDLVHSQQLKINRIQKNEAGHRRSVAFKARLVVRPQGVRRKIALGSVAHRWKSRIAERFSKWWTTHRLTEGI